jgi:transcriptional regulator GlxA family with amidase domain
MRPIQELQVWIADNLTRADLSTPALADRVAMSVRNFTRVFTADVGTTPARYVLHLRVEAARRLLESSSYDLRQIATRAGFGSADAMRRAFVRVLGRSPNDVRPPKARRVSVAPRPGAGAAMPWPAECSGSAGRGSSDRSRP